MKSKKNVLSSLMIMLAGVIYFSAQAQQKIGTHRTDFSGEWKSKESISMGGNIVCTYREGDRMLYKTMKITQEANFLSIAVSDPSPNPGPAKSQEKLSFDGKATEINSVPGFGKKSTVKWSADGQTMTVNSIVRLMTTVPYQVNVKKQALVYVTEVWKLSNDGKAISVQTNARSGLLGPDRERNWTTVFDKATWYSKLFL
ncbi:MAG: hypothetical protein V4594_20665 [Bacteroidota bacterium]